MELTLGPILSFRGISSDQWRLSALVVLDSGDAAPALNLQAAGASAITATAKLLR